MGELPIYIDIDGTLTTQPRRGGLPIFSRISQVKKLIEEGHAVVLWSANGAEYVEQFAKENGLNHVICLSKPSVVVDDCPTIRPADRMPVKHPKDFFDGQ